MVPIRRGRNVESEMRDIKNKLRKAKKDHCVNVDKSALCKFLEGQIKRKTDNISIIRIHYDWRDDRQTSESGTCPPHFFWVPSSWNRTPETLVISEVIKTLRASFVLTFGL